MAINTIKKALSIAPNGIPTVVRLSQNENGRTLEFELSDAVPFPRLSSSPGRNQTGTSTPSPGLRSTLTRSPLTRKHS